MIEITLVESLLNEEPVIGIILGVYVVKVVIAALDTPLCYLGVRMVERVTGIDARSVS